MLVRNLVDQGHQVTVYHRGKTPAPLPPGVKEVLGDRRDYRRFHEQMRELNPEVVVDMMCSDDQDARSLVNAFAGRVRQVVVISSYEVYRAFSDAWFRRPSMQAIPIPESAPLREEVFLYGTSHRYDKLLVERELIEAGRLRDFPYTIIRWPALYGPGDPTPREWYYVKQVLDRRPRVMLPAGGQSIFCRGYLENMAHAVQVAIGNPRANKMVFNACDSQCLTVRQIVEGVASVLGHEWETVFVPRPLVPEGPHDQARPYSIDPYDVEPHLQFDVSSIRALGYRDQVDCYRALENTVRWLVDHPAPAGWMAVDYEHLDRILDRCADL